MGRPRSWSDDDLRRAVAESTTYKEVVERLRERRGSASHRSVRVRIEVLGLDLSHFWPRARSRPGDGPDGASTPGRSGRRRRWSEEDLRAAVSGSTSLAGVFRHLGLAIGGDQWQTIRGLIRELGIDTAHWDRPIGSDRRAWSDEELIRLVPRSRSIGAVMRALGIPPGGGTQRRITERIRELDLDTSHMLGRGWARGARGTGGGREPKPLAAVLVAGSGYPTNLLKKRLIDEGLKTHRCEGCGLTVWRGRPIPLHLDHVNGDRRDHRLDNLRVLCPNCHAQTETYGGRNIGRYARERRAAYNAA